ncbi:hypothetical protein N2152v2_007332 [Parachlorella kessleri]
MSLDDVGGPVQTDAAEEAGGVSIGSQDWRKALNAVVPCVVVLKVTQTRAFDTEGAGSSYATGFIVDKKRGIILTNRHVVTPGPIVAEAVFLNREEVTVQPLYYDPVHDFGFMRFDPGKVQFMEFGEVPLAPEAACVGLDIRVVGNDSGEKISILSGTLARLDRDAPHYTRKGFNDFNTFYLQAASGTKGGSSGSPVIDVQGRAVGLNAGGKNKAASAYYLPLNRVVRALELLQGCLDEQPEGWSATRIPRGDLQATFLFKGFDEVRRLGLRKETEAEVRAAHQSAAAAGIAEYSTGMLVVESVVPGGPADGVLEPGDVLVRLDGGITTDFLSMEDLLDARVGAQVALEFQRGGNPVIASIKVQDLHAVTPSSMVELGGGTVHELSYQQARNNRAATGQVYVAEPGKQEWQRYLLGKAAVPKCAIITAVAGQPTHTLDQFVDTIKGLSHGQRVPLELYTFGDRNRKKNVLLHCDWNWYGPPRRWTRNDARGVWDDQVEWPHSLAPIAATGAAAAAEGSGALPPSPKISSPRIQVAATPFAGGAAKPPRHPGAPQGKAPAPSPLSLPAAGLPRRHSVQDVPTVDIEKTQPGVTAQHDDARLEVATAAMEVDQGGQAGAGAARTAPGATPAAAAGLPGAELGMGVEAPAAAAPAAAAAVAEGPVAAGGPATEVGGRTGAAGAAAGSTPTAAGTAGPASSSLVQFEERLRCALVMVDVEIPLVALSDGVHSRAFTGCGVIMHHSDTLGLVLVDRNTVCVGPGDVMLSFGAFPAEVPARVRFLHPLHNFALVSYDPQELSLEARRLIRAVELLPAPALRRGDSVELVCLSASLRILHRTSLVTNPAMSVMVRAAEVPRFRAVHEEVIKLDQDFGTQYAGVLTDKAGRVRALWGSYSEQVDKSETEWTAGKQAGLPASVFAPWVEALKALKALDAPGEAPAPLRVRVLDAELEPLLLSKAAQFGLPSEWVLRLVKLDPERRQVLRVRSCTANSHAQQVLKDGDMVLAVAGRPVSSYDDVERLIAAYHPPPSPTGNEGAGVAAAAAAAGCAAGANGVAAAAAVQDEAAATAVKEPSAKRQKTSIGAKAAAVTGNGSSNGSMSAGVEVPLTIFRGGEVLEARVRLGLEDGLGTDRLYPHRAVRAKGYLPANHGVYISRWHHGSPAHRYALFALHWITEVNGEPTPDIDTFLRLVKGLPDGADVRVRVEHFETTRSKVLTLKTDNRYWPAWELQLDPRTAQWTRLPIQ